MSTNDTTPAPTPWPTRNQVITALGQAREPGDLASGWDSILVRLRQHAEQHTALRAARELLERERQALSGERPDADPIDARPSGSLAVFDAIAKVGKLETETLARYVCCAQAALELLAAGGVPAWNQRLHLEEPRRDRLTSQPVLPEPGEERGALRVPEGSLEEAPGVDLLHRALRQFDALEDAHQEWDDAFGCNEYCDDLEDGCGGSPHIPEHMIDQAAELEQEMDRGSDYVADYADAVAWTLTHGLRDRLQAQAGADA